jgi:hypothetical protein
MNQRQKSGFAGESGQALLEVALSASILFLLLFGVIDISRALYYQQVMKTLTAEGSAMASRGASTSVTASTVINDAGSNLDFTKRGCVIVTSVTNTGATKNPLQIGSGQQSASGSCTGITSKVGCAPPASGCGNATLPSEAIAGLEVNQSLFITEIYYSYAPVTPFAGGKLLPKQLYDAAYY